MRVVAVGMSGGVDSSVCAYLLKESKEFDEVIGITLKFFNAKECRVGLSHNICCSPKDVKDAKEVCQRLGIKHWVLSWEKLFKEKVIRYFLEEYSKGRTPNPCCVCNREVKTGFLARYLREAFGIEKLATGHYARILKTSYGFTLARARDKRRDQSYFLSLIKREDLKLLLFPLGERSKEEVREIAKEAGLKVYKKRDSFEVCFLMGEEVRDYLSRHFEFKEGYIVHVSGKVLGKHKGFMGYTVGQRRGLGVSYKKPLYVISLVPEKNLVVVGEEEYLYNDQILVSSLNFLLPLEAWNGATCQIRYRGKEYPLKSLEKVREGLYLVKLKEPAKSITPGQVITFYKGDLVLGGGFIEGYNLCN